MENRIDTVKKTTRREQILEAAFKLSEASESWSLAEVAGLIGVSKTAIYRHFHSRSEIDNEIRRQMLQDILSTIDSSYTSPIRTRSALVALFREKPAYHQLIMKSIFSDPDFDRHILSFLIAGSGRFASFFAGMERLPPERRRHISSWFLMNCVSIMIISFDIEAFQRNQEEFLDILEKGLPDLGQPDDARLDELDKACALPEGYSGAGSEQMERLFAAITGTIRCHGIKGTTIERIAEQMGRAKSSLYFYGKTKKEMISLLLARETANITTLCAERLVNGKTFAEQLYIIMATQANYILSMPGMIPVFNWIRYELVANHYEAPHEAEDLDRFLGLFRQTGRGEDKDRTLAFVKWALILSASVVIHERHPGACPEDISKHIRVMFRHMMGGDKELYEEL